MFVGKGDECGTFSLRRSFLSHVALWHQGQQHSNEWLETCTEEQRTYTKILIYKDWAHQHTGTKPFLILWYKLNIFIS